MTRLSGLPDDFDGRGSLDAFDDILRSGCGTPDGGFEFLWLNSQALQEGARVASHDPLVRHTITRCHSANVLRLTADLQAAGRGEGTTLFDWIEEIIERHGPGGSEAEDNVLLRLL